LAELKWESGKTQHRIVGMFRGQKEFVFLIGCTHKEQRYKPTEALDTANTRRQMLSPERANEGAKVEAYEQVT
jgi:hypothetical protein